MTSLAVRSFSAASANEKKPIKLFSTEYYLNCAVGGILSCGITHTVITPLDVIKCNMQVNPKYKSISHGFRVIMAESGFRGLALGWAPTAIGYSLQGACKFGFYELFKKKYADVLGAEKANEWKTSLYLAASASAEIIADVALCPFEAMKVRIQTNPGFATSMREAYPKIMQSEGFSGFYKGLVALWSRQVPYTMMKFACFQRTVEAIYDNVVPKPRSECSKGEQLGVTFAAGYIAGIFCGIVSHPADTMVSKLNMVETSGSTVDAMKIVLKETGFMGLWKGVFARVLMIGTLTALQWYIYDGFKVAVGLPTTGASEEKTNQQ